MKKHLFRAGCCLIALALFLRESGTPAGIHFLTTTEALALGMFGLGLLLPEIVYQLALLCTSQRPD